MGNYYLKSLSDSEVNALLELISAHFHSTSDSWRLAIVDIENVIPLCKHVYTQRLEFARSQIEACHKYSIPLFYPYRILDSEKSQIVVPPIIEEREAGLFLGDGMHRLFASLSKKQKIYALITGNCKLPLPGTPQRWSDVTEEPVQLPVELNFEKFNRAALTGYSKFTNNIVF